jgi:hypothetical protein
MSLLGPDELRSRLQVRFPLSSYQVTCRMEGGDEGDGGSSTHVEGRLCVSPQAITVTLPAVMSSDLPTQWRMHSWVLRLRIQ